MKRQTLLIASTLALAVLTGVGMAGAQVPPWGGPMPPVRLCPKLIIPGPAETSSETVIRGAATFSAAKTTDIVFHLLFDPSLADDHVVTLKIFTPHGHLYRVLDVPIARKKGEAPLGTRRLPGYPYPVKVQAPRNVISTDGNPYASVDVSFPVAGSAIVTSSLYGRWRVEVYMDGAGQPCSDPLFFQIRQ